MLPGPTNCTVFDTLFVEAFDNTVYTDIFIPNSFTPNNDGFNDTFGPVTTGITSLYMEITDRNGRIVFIIDQVNGRWDGKTTAGQAVPQGTYYYSFQATGADSKSYTRQGSITLFREIIDITPNPVKSKGTITLHESQPGLKQIVVYTFTGTPVFGR